MELALLLDIGSTYTKGVVVNLDQLRLEAKAKSLTTIGDDVSTGIKNVLNQLETEGINLDSIEYRLACSSAAGGLKMVAIGLVPDLTAEAANRAALGAGAKVADVYSYKLTEMEVKKIVKQKPDVILLAGGTNGGNKGVILHNATQIADSGLSAPIIIAGNKVAAKEAEKILQQADKKVHITENVMPELEKLNIEPARETIREVFLDQIIYAKGLAEAEKYIDEVIMPTPSAVMNAAQLLAQGTEPEEGLGELIVADIGGATTDIHSVAAGEPTQSGVNLRGLEEPYVKRTVEGDLGMRYSAVSLLKIVGADKLVNYLPDEIKKDELIDYIDKVKADVEYVPQDKREEKLDAGIGQAAVDLAVQRHVGEIETVYSPFGESYVQYGKDLTNLDLVIGTGGVLVHNQFGLKILQESLFTDEAPTVLAPKNPKFMVDKKYILSAVGLLAELLPTKALKLAKKYLKVLDRRK